MTTPTQTTPTPTTPIGSNWPSLPIPGDTTEPETSQGSPIQPAQKSPTAWKGQQRGPEEHEADRVGRFAKYFKGNEILPIPEIADKIAPRVLSLVVSDLKTKRLVGLTKEVFEDLIRKAGIPCQYFCRKSFATWDVLLPTEKQAAKVAESDVITKNFRLQPEYKGTRRLRVTVCNVPAIITGEVLAAYLSAYGHVEEFNLLRSPAGTAYGDYAFRLCLTRDGFKAIPETLICGDRQMMVMVEGRRPRCWGCKQIGHIAKFCPQRPENKEKASTSTTTTTTKDAAAPTITKEAEAKGPGQVQPQNNQEGWTEVTKKRRGSPKQGVEKSPNTSPPQKQTRAQAAAVAAAEPPIAAAAVAAATRTTETAATTTTRTPADATVTKTTETAATTTTTTEQQTAAAAKKPRKAATPKKPATPKTPTAPSPKKGKKTTKTYEDMETTTNLKRRRDSGEGAAKKLCPEKTPPEAGPSSQPSPPVPSPLPPLPSPTFPPPKITLPSPPQQMAPLSPQQELFFKKHHRPYKIPLPRSQSAERAQPSGLARTPSLPSLGPTDFSSQELFPAMISPKRNPPEKKKQELTIGQMQRAAALCSAELEAVGDFQLRKALKPLARLETINNLKVSNPANFRSAAMVTTFVRSAGDRTKGVWKYLSTVCQTDTGIKLAELEHSSLKKCLTYCSGRVPILVHPSLYRALKLKFPIDVGGITRDNRVTTELGTGSLRQAVGILTPKDFRPVVDDE